MPTGYWYDACAFSGVFIVVETRTNQGVTVVVKKRGRRAAGGDRRQRMSKVRAASRLRYLSIPRISKPCEAIGSVRWPRFGRPSSAPGCLPVRRRSIGYTVSFRPRAGLVVATIPAADLDARPAGKERGVALTLSREMDSQLPQRVTVQSLDSDREYATGEQYAERLNTAAVNIRTLEMPLAPHRRRGRRGSRKRSSTSTGWSADDANSRCHRPMPTWSLATWWRCLRIAGRTPCG